MAKYMPFYLKCKENQVAAANTVNCITECERVDEIHTGSFYFGLLMSTQEERTPSLKQEVWSGITALNS